MTIRTLAALVLLAVACGGATYPAPETCDAASEARVLDGALHLDAPPLDAEAADADAREDAPDPALDCVCLAAGLVCAGVPGSATESCARCGTRCSSDAATE